MPALLYLEARYLAHAAGAVARSPLRALLWAFYLAGALATLVFRLRGPHSAVAGVSIVSAQTATAIAGGYLVLLGISVAGAALGKAASFRSPVEPTLFAAARIAPRTVVAWLQLRKFAAGWTRAIVFAYLWLSIGAPERADAATLVRGIAGGILAAAILTMCELPVFVLAARRVRTAFVAAGAALIAAGIAFAALGMFAGYAHVDAALRLLQALPDPGRFVAALVAGNAVAFGLLLLAPIGLFAAMLVLGPGAWPDLCAATLQRGRTAGGLRRRRATPATPTRSRWIPGGAFVLLWTDWLAFARARGNLPLWAFNIALAVALGSGVLALSRLAGDASLAFEALAVGITFALFAPATAAVALGTDLGKPIWWLTRTALASRLATWALGRSWRGALVTALAIDVVLLGSGSIAAAAVAPLLAVLTWWSLYALGVALYAVFPSALDQNAPILMIRIGATSLVLVPPIALGVLLVAATQSLAPAFVGAPIALGLEGWLFIAFAARRLAGGAATIAPAERAA